MADKSAFPHPRYGTLEMKMPESPGITIRELQWTIFAAVSLPVLLLQGIKSGEEEEIQQVPEAVCATADAIMAAIAEREQERDDEI